MEDNSHGPEDGFPAEPAADELGTTAGIEHVIGKDDLSRHTRAASADLARLDGEIAAEERYLSELKEDEQVLPEKLERVNQNIQAAKAERFRKFGV